MNEHSRFRDFPASLWSHLRDSLREEKKTNANPIAAFDADGTLWDTDLGENFFRYQIRERLLQGIPSDPWGHYRTWKSTGDPRPAYLWLAQINKGNLITQVRAWAEAATRSLEPLPVFPEKMKLINWLRAEGVAIYIVTASVKWAVEPGAIRLGLRGDDVLGVETRIDGLGMVTDEACGYMTYREGKAQALLQATGGIRPFLAIGNTKGDLALLETATRIQLAVTASLEGDELFPSEHELQLEAAKRGWLAHRYR